MKTIATALIALSVLAGVVAPASAADGFSSSSSTVTAAADMSTKPSDSQS